jgi:hypothetical protein
MKKPFTMEVSLEEVCMIVKFCEGAGRSPLDVLLKACGKPDSEAEPYIFDISRFVDIPNYTTWEQIEERIPVSRTRRGAQNDVYLGLLSQLLKWNESKVSAALSEKRGRHRIYFSKHDHEIRMSGRNIDAHPIPGTDWFACTHMNARQKCDILYNLLLSLGFSKRYSWLIAFLPDNKRPQISGFSIGAPK